MIDVLVYVHQLPILFQSGLDVEVLDGGEALVSVYFVVGHCSGRAALVPTLEILWSIY